MKSQWTSIQVYTYCLYMHTYVSVSICVYAAENLRPLPLSYAPPTPSPPLPLLPLSQMWPLLLEKAYAKSKGSYHAIEGGRPLEAMKDLTGYGYVYWSRCRCRCRGPNRVRIS
ncbi:hypothetical protein B484DRAFT_225516 [Ochromonadaceae sp. CCMP2298]|nr:hypothetical protein B484DRAFT_225516 [Ochromonadaceae sp. CCMP2298]